MPCANTRHRVDRVVTPDNRLRQTAVYCANTVKADKEKRPRITASAQIDESAFTSSKLEKHFQKPVECKQKRLRKILHHCNVTTEKTDTFKQRYFQSSFLCHFPDLHKLPALDLQLYHPILVLSPPDK